MTSATALVGFGEEREPEPLLGYVERCDCTGIEGWAFSPDHAEERVELEISCDGTLAGRAVADQYRGDLRESGFLGDGRCAFETRWAVPPNPLTGHVIEIRRARDRVPMPGSPFVMPAAAAFDKVARDALSAVMHDAAAAAAATSELEPLIRFLGEQLDTLATARSRLAAADIDPHHRWGGQAAADPALAPAGLPAQPRALFLDERFPSRQDSAGANAALDHMRSLRQLGFEVRFAAAHDIGDKAAAAGSLAERGITALTRPWYASIEEILARHAGQLDLVYLHRADIALAYAKLVRRYCPAAMLVYGVADLHHVRLARQSKALNQPALMHQARRLHFEETTAARLADLVITHSPVEAAMLRQQLSGLPVAVIPWAVPARETTPGFAAREGVVFIGNFSHAPNVDAVHYLASTILPWIRCKAPHIAFRAIGSNPPEHQRRVSQPGLEIVGPVDDIDAVLKRARLTIAPLRFGAGLKGKVVESLAAGVPCVGTSIAYEGLAPPPALASCIADRAGELVAAVMRLYGDAVAHAEIATAGRGYVADAFSEAAVDQLMRQAVAPVLQRRATLQTGAK